MVRLAELEDIDALLKLGNEYHKNIPHSSMPFDNEKCRRFISTYLPKRTEWLFLIAEKDTPTGFFIGMIQPTFFSSELRSYELIWYIHPDYAASKDNLKMFEIYMYWASKAGCTHIGASHLTKDKRVAKYYERKGFFPLESSYIKVVNGS